MARIVKVTLILFTLYSVILSSTAVHAQIVVSAPTTKWKKIKYGGANSTDPLIDQQTGQPEGDLVGNASNALFYSSFEIGTPSLTDGTIYYRARVGADSATVGFTRNLFLGIDAGGTNGAGIDLFVGVNNTGSNHSISMWAPGTGLNTGPSTTSIVSPPLASFSVVESASNYNFSVVSTTIDPGITSLDLQGDGTDYFVSFSLPFSSLVSALNGQGITGVNQNTQFKYILGTATQDNAINQDMGGTQGNLNSALTFAQLGAISDLTSPLSSAVIPEPGTFSLLGSGLAGLALLRRRARRG